MEWYLMVWRKYAEFTGRSRRKEYWMFTLVNIVVALVLELLAFESFTTTRGSATGALFAILIAVYGLAALIPSLAVCARRLHDIGMSGWLMLIGLIPGLGGVALIVLCALDGNPGPNRYGPNPKVIQPMMMNF